MRPLNSVLVMASHNETVSSLRAFFNRSIPIWEGHTREALDRLYHDLHAHNGNPLEVGKTAVNFVSGVAAGFSSTGYSCLLLEEIEQGCIKRRRNKPATLQSLGRIILEQPDHKGVGRFLVTLRTLTKEDEAFAAIKIDHSREYNDAIHFGRFDSPDEGLAEIVRRRAHSRAAIPSKAISTIQKAKGLEFPHVVVAACDRQHFGDTKAARARLYVALSRATESLTLLVSHTDPTPLLRI